MPGIVHRVRVSKRTKIYSGSLFQMTAPSADAVFCFNARPPANCSMTPFQNLELLSVEMFSRLHWHTNAQRKDAVPVAAVSVAALQPHELVVSNGQPTFQHCACTPQPALAWFAPGELHHMLHRKKAKMLDFPSLAFSIIFWACPIISNGPYFVALSSRCCSPTRIASIQKKVV